MTKKHSQSLEPTCQYTELLAGVGLKIPVFDMSLENGKEKGRYQIEPEILRNSMLELLFKPEELATLTIVKPDPHDSSLDPLKNIDFGDGIARRVAFSSGKNVYFADKELSAKLLSVFTTQPDHSCRYGSLLVSSCTQGVQLLDCSVTGETLRVKIVDSQSDDPSEKALAQRYQTGDCHGKISPTLAQQLDGIHNRPFQFRFAWLSDWEQENCATPQINFLAKGTLLPDSQLTDNLGYDIIMDRSSIKGVAALQLAELIPCGDYEFPKAVLGNRGNAKVTEYENSWQFSIWYSEAAIQTDIATPTKLEAQKLADLQNNRLQLAKYLVEQHDKKVAFQSNIHEDNNGLEDETDEKAQRNEYRLISILRNDKLGQLLDFPKVVDFMQEQLAKKWRDLAIKGAIHHGSAMAQPCEDLKPGTIVAPHLKNGTEVIVTRYPIVSKDNIRRYTVDNKSHPELMQYKGCAFIRPDQAMQHHQCDFDGDQLVITPASKLPNIASETRHANQENEYEAVSKRSKIDYTKATDEEGNRKYTKLRQIAVAIAHNKIGWVATLIGRVQSSVPQPKQPTNLFNHKKQKLLGQLFDALQIEVDSPKSATRTEDYHPNLLNLAKQWSNEYPSYLFDFKDDPRLYKTVPLPAEDNAAISCIARSAVNPEWEPTRLTSRHRDEFRYLFPSPKDLDEREDWEKYYVTWAKDTKERYRERMAEIYEQQGDDLKAIREAVGKLYESLRTDVADAFPHPKERMLAASALWHVETTNPNLDVPRKACLELSRQLKIEFHLESDYERLHEALPKDTYILSVPFQKLARDGSGQIKRDSKRQPISTDLAGEWKEKLDNKGIKYEASLHPSLPMVNFALLDPNEKLVEVLDQEFGNNENDIDSLNLTYRDRLGRTQTANSRIVAPASYNWVESKDSQTPKAALVLNLFSDEICQQLQTFQFETVELIGQKYNDFKDVDFSTEKWKGKRLSFEVDAFKSDTGNYRDGSPIVKLNDRQLAMFSPNSPKLPIGATFEATIESSPKSSALILNIDPASLRLIEEAAEVEILSVKGKSAPNREGFGEDIRPGKSLSQISQQQQSQAQQKNCDSATISELMQAAIGNAYQKTGAIEFPVGSWGVFVNSKTQKCTVEDESGAIIFAADLKSERIIKGLSEENSAKFVAEILENTTPKRFKKSRLPATVEL
ncbi:hypothetical protein QT970_03610 [Microcoleus sp. herbarium8]|uniref:hypothetical protein n=1 Tax=Microcoleus sp. herbarium8 TaxID=3055436 RepID=UPI002FD5C6C4